MALLEQYSTSKIRHPSWRVYQTLAIMKERFGESSDIMKGLSEKTFCLREDIDIYLPYEGIDRLTETLIEAFSTDNYTNDTIPITDAISLFMDVEGRQYVEALLMNGMTPFDAADDTGYSIEFIQTYSSLFFDVTVWRTHADKNNYLIKGTCGKDKEVKMQVDKNGLDYAKARLFHVASKIKLEQAIVNLFSEMYQQTMRYIHMDTPEDQEAAQGWAKLTIATYKELKNASQSDGGIKELTIALQAAPAPRIGIEDLKKSKEE